MRSGAFARWYSAFVSILIPPRISNPVIRDDGAGGQKAKLRCMQCLTSALSATYDVRSGVAYAGTESNKIGLIVGVELAWEWQTTHRGSQAVVWSSTGAQ